MNSKFKNHLLFVACLIFFYHCPGQHTTHKVNFSHPLWSIQSNIYEVNLRQYTAEGTFKAFEKHLLRLRKMGVEILWFMPITPIGVEGRKMTTSDLGSYYAVKNYKEVNEDYGTMKDWIALVKLAHGMGFKIIVDWVANHSSPDNPWIKNHPDFYMKDKDGTIIPPNPDWTDTRKLNFDNRELRDSMIEAMKFWIRETNIDGFRCDVAGDVPTDFWKDCISKLRKIKNIFMLAEGEKPELNLAGFDATYTWTIMHGMKDLYNAKITLGKFDSLINNNIQIFPKNAFRLYFTSNHDENSWNGTEFEKYGDAYKAFAVLTQTIYQSIPLVYSGQEEPNRNRLKFFIKDTIQWGKYEMAPFYKTLLKIRKSTPALAADALYKKIVTANDVAIFAYLREKAGHKIAVILNLSNQPQRFTIKDNSLYGEPINIFLGVKEKLSREHVYSLEPWGYIVYDYD
ncbi:MAG: alpha-amylase family glycosyl hydrolase [Ginsengibacter sp.]